MAKQEYSAYQKSIITNYYNNRSDIALGKLSELVSELFLADTDAKRDRLWERAHKAMVNLKIPPVIIDHIMTKKDVKILAKNLNEWLARPEQSRGAIRNQTPRASPVSPKALIITKYSRSGAST